MVHTNNFLIDYRGVGANPMPYRKQGPREGGYAMFQVKLLGVMYMKLIQPPKSRVTHEFCRVDEYKI